MSQALEDAAGVLAATALFAWLIWLHAEIQATTRAYRHRTIVKQRRCS